ncbi:MAG: translation elongation factor Ts [Planctomycetota bacterium]
MPAISAKDVMKLRASTGLGMMECKKALTEAEGDMDKAAEIVRTKFGAKMDKRSDRDATEGKVAVALSDDGSTGAIVLIATETDFTANNEQFVEMAQKIADQTLADFAPGSDAEANDAITALIEPVKLVTQENIQFGKGVVLGGPGKTVGSYVHFTGKTGVLVELEGGDVPEQTIKDLCMHISAIVPEPLGISADDIPAEAVEEEKARALKDAMDSGKPQEIAEKMVTGKMRKYLDSVALLRQPFVKDDKQQVASILPDGISITRFAKYQIGG